MFSEEDLDPEMLGELVTESREHLTECEPIFLKMEREGAATPDEIDQIFRNIHSVKGGFRLFGYSTIIDITHAIEAIFSRVREGELVVDYTMVERLIVVMDKVTVLINDPTHSKDISIEEEMSLMLPYLDEESMNELQLDYSHIQPKAIEDSTEASDEAIETVPEASDKETSVQVNFIPGKVEFLNSEFGDDNHVFEPFIRTGKNLFLIDGSSAITSTEEFANKMLEDNNVFEGYTPYLKDLTELKTAWAEYAGYEGKVLLMNSVLEQEMMEFAVDAELKDIYQVVFVDEFSVAEVVEEVAEVAEVAVAQPSEPTAAPVPEVVSEPKVQVEVSQSKPLPPMKSESNKSNADESIRVKVELLNSLMNAAGELILNRNQLLQAFNKSKAQFFDATDFDHEIDRFGENLIKSIEYNAKQGIVNHHNLDDFLQNEYKSLNKFTEDSLAKPLNSDAKLNTLVQSLDRNTSTLQENIMSTRMQPIMNLFNKFPRIIRDLSMSLEKEVELDLMGRNVELDKTILEKLADPMVHLIRNSMDHGIEMPDERVAAGKDRKGTVALNAYHEGGKVIITISDDGGGIRRDKILSNAVNKGIVDEAESHKMSDKEVWNLIFAAGFSTADQVSDISGRGVGMDVVKTNIESLGGTIEVESAEGKGSTFTMRLPLTLAIIPSLIVGVHGLTFAIPQLALEEIVRIRSTDVPHRIERIHNSEVLRLRERILPLIRLSDLLDSKPMFKHPTTGEWKEDKRTRWSDRRNDSILSQAEQDAEDLRRGESRRKSIQNALQIVILKVGNNTFGMIVDKVFDNEEIVIKPLSRYLSQYRAYSGMAILGSGEIAMILDVNGLSNLANLKFAETDTKLDDAELVEENKIKELQKFLVFRNHENDRLALTLDLVNRVKYIKMSELQEIGGREFLNTEDSSIEILRLESILPIKDPGLKPDDDALVLIPTLVRHPIGILCSQVEDIVQISVNLAHKEFDDKGIIGTFLLDSELVMVLDIYEMFEQFKPEKYVLEESKNPFEGKKVLLAEDTQFFQRVITKFLLEQGFTVDVADDGEKAWDKLMTGNHYDILISDVQMPHLDGFGLVERVRKNSKVSHMPIMMLTSMSNDSYRERGAKLGVDAYEIKLDKARQVETLTRLLKK